MQTKTSFSFIKTNNRNKRLEHAVIAFMTVAIAALILFRDLGGINISRFIFIGIATVICLLSDKSDIYCLIAFLTPLSTGISYTYITAIALVILLYKNRQLQFQPTGMIFMFGILVLELFSGFGGMFSLIEFLRFAGIFVFSFLRIFDLKKDYNNSKILHSYIFGYWVAMASIIGQMLQEYSVQEFLSLGVRFGNTRMLLNPSYEGILVSYNENGLGILCVIVGLFCLLFYQKSKNKLYLLSFIGSSFLGIMTQSRTFILIYILGILLYTLFSFQSIKHAVKSLFFMAIGTTVIIGGAIWLIPEYLKNFYQRFYDADLLNGRGQIASYYFDKALKYIDRIFFGVGLQNYTEKYNYNISIHNATLEVFITWGLIGLTFVTILIILMIKNARTNNPSSKSVQFIPLLIFLVAIQAGQGFSNYYNIVSIMILYSAIVLPLTGGKLYSNEPNKHSIPQS